MEALPFGVPCADRGARRRLSVRSVHWLGYGGSRVRSGLIDDFAGVVNSALPAFGMQWVDMKAFFESVGFGVALGHGNS